VVSYRDKLDTYVTPTLGDVELQAVDALDLDGLYERLRRHGGRGGRPLSLRTVRYVHTILHKALSDAERKGLVVVNVARRAELCGLRWVDVDDTRVMMRQTATLVDGEVVVGEPTTNRSRRTIGLDAATATVLRAHHRSQAETRLLVGTGWHDHGLVFCGPAGEPLNGLSVSQRFDRAVRRSGLPRVRFHDLRHGHTAHLLAAGVNPKVVSERLGHAPVAFTLDAYGHVLPGQQADAAAGIAALVDVGGAERYQTATTGPTEPTPMPASPRRRRRPAMAGGAVPGLRT
jgi:integrase